MPRLLLKQMTLFDSVEDTLKNKYCPDCTETKSTSSFYKNKLNKEGLNLKNKISNDIKDTINLLKNI